MNKSMKFGVVKKSGATPGGKKKYGAVRISKGTAGRKKKT